MATSTPAAHLLVAAVLLLVGCGGPIGRLGAFNVDTVNYVRHDGPAPDSMYGFSVALHREKQQSW